MADPSRPVTGYPAYPNGHPPPPNSHPQPHAQSYPYTYQNPYYSPSEIARQSFLRAFIVGIIAVFIVTAVILFIIWLVLRPQIPQFHLNSLQVSNFSVSSQSLSASWVIGFSVYNPNKKMTVSYDTIDSSIYYNNELLSQTRLPPFDQDRRTQTAVSGSFSSVDSYIDGSIVSKINEDRRRGAGAVNFNVRVWARVGFRAGWWKTRRRLLRVLCENLVVELPPSSSSNRSVSGKLMGESRECKVGI